MEGLEIYANEKDTCPIRTGIVIATSQDEAEHLAPSGRRKTYPKADLTPLIAERNCTQERPSNMAQTRVSLVPT